jgi:serine/threonine protein kinase
VKKIAEKSDTSINNDCHRLKSLIQNKDIYDLISQLLLFQPEKRISAREVLDHHFLKIENEVIQETSSDPALICLMNSFENSFDTRANTLTDMRRYILREISAYHENMVIDTSAFFYEDSLKKNRKQIAANANRIDDKISTCLIV